jgi:GH15 family glucan-1,4-alpha-glucosidase
MAFLAAGDRARAESLFAWAQRLRAPDGSYFTGHVHPHGAHFPGGERTTYSSAAVVLAADAMSGACELATLGTAAAGATMTG